MKDIRVSKTAVPYWRVLLSKGSKKDQPKICDPLSLIPTESMGGCFVTEPSGHISKGNESTLLLSEVAKAQSWSKRLS